MFDHVVVLMLENQSFDRMLGYLQAVNPAIDGIDADHPRSNPDVVPGSGPIEESITTARHIEDDPQHDLKDVLTQITGPTPTQQMQGFVANFANRYPTSSTDERAEIMAHYPRGFLPALHSLAEAFVVCDRWFSSMPGPTWPNRFFVHSGTSLGHVDMPEGVFSPGVHVYDQTTIYQLLEGGKKSWAVYYGDFPQSLVLLNQLQYPTHYHPMADFAAAAAGPESAFPAYVFIEPSYFGDTQNDQHPPHDVVRGDALIADVYNALKANPALFAKTLLVILYDEHGGFYDHVPPPAAVAPDDNVSDFAFDRLGVRVPAVLVSPLLAAGTMSETFDHTSLLRFVIDQWGLDPARRNPLGKRVAAAKSFGPLLTPLSQPRTMPVLPVLAPEPVTPSPAMAGHQSSLLAYSQYLESQITDPGVKAALMARSHEVLGTAAEQATLTQDRLAAFLADRAAMLKT